MPIGDKAMLQWVVDAAEASKLDRVVVVTGHAADAVRAGVRLGRGEWDGKRAWLAWAPWG